MKWLSVKKYNPPAYNMSVFVRVKCNDNSYLHDVGYYDNGIWFTADNNEYSFDMDGHEVTHFCIPDSVEREEKI